MAMIESSISSNMHEYTVLYYVREFLLLQKWEVVMFITKIQMFDNL